MIKKPTFSPVSLINQYLSGKSIGLPEKRLIRNTLTTLLMFQWASIKSLPGLAIEGSLPLADLPFLSDREKLFLVVDCGLEKNRPRGIEHPRLHRVNDRTILRFTVVKYRGPEMEREEGLAETTVTTTVADLDALLRGEYNYRELYGFRLLRLYTLLYRPRKKWTPEERAIMREKGIKLTPKKRDIKLYRNSW